MSLTFGFYNSLDGDRTYDAIQMSSIFDGIINDGIFQTIGDVFEITAMSGNTVGVGSGRAWFDHTWTLNDSRIPIELGPTLFLDDRIDAVVLEINELIRTNRILVIEGEPARRNPSRPELTNTNYVHQYALAYIYRSGTSEEVTQEDITSVIGTEETPYATGITIGGGGGTSDYEDLLNKPQIEGVVLLGDKSFSDLTLDRITNIEIDNLVNQTINI